jgi:acylphosphatase
MAAAATDPQQQPPPPKAVLVKVKGHMQDVFFRDWTVKTAHSLGLDGWVRNRLYGTVEALFTGDPAMVDEMVSTHLPKGPPPPPSSLPWCPGPSSLSTRPTGSSGSPPPDPCSLVVSQFIATEL